MAYKGCLLPRRRCWCVYFSKKNCFPENAFKSHDVWCLNSETPNISIWRLLFKSTSHLFFILGLIWQVSVKAWFLFNPHCSINYIWVTGIIWFGRNYCISPLFDTQTHQNFVQFAMCTIGIYFRDKGHCKASWF